MRCVNGSIKTRKICTHPCLYPPVALAHVTPARFCCSGSASLSQDAAAASAGCQELLTAQRAPRVRQLYPRLLAARASRECLVPTAVCCWKGRAHARAVEQKLV